MPPPDLPGEVFREPSTVGRVGLLFTEVAVPADGAELGIIEPLAGHGGYLRLVVRGHDVRDEEGVRLRDDRDLVLDAAVVGPDPRNRAGTSTAMAATDEPGGYVPGR